MSGSIIHTITMDNNDCVTIMNNIMTVQIPSYVSGRTYWTEKQKCWHYIYCNKDFSKTDIEDTDFTKIKKLPTCNIQ